MKFLHIEIKRLVLVVIAVIVMGLCLSFLEPCGFGTDPCTCMNLGISRKIGMTLGNWQALLNCILFLVVIVFDRGQLGWGTVANMFLVGHSFDFFTWLTATWMPEGAIDFMPARFLIVIPAMFVFVLAALVCMASVLGTSPYVAVPFIIPSKCIKIPFRIVRMVWDISVCIIGFLFGSTVGVVTLIMAFVLGPVIAWMKENVIGRLLYGRN